MFWTTQRAGVWAFLVLSGCSAIPPFPPAPDLAKLRSMDSKVTESSDGQIGYSVGSVRLAEHGLYVDLLVSGPQGVHRAAESRAFLVSGAADPNEWIQVEDSIGPVELLPMRRPQYLGGLWRMPQYTLGDSEGRERLVQTCMFRTRRNCEPGPLRIRLTGLWRHGPDGSTYMVDTEWREVYVEMAAGPRNVSMRSRHLCEDSFS